MEAHDWLECPTTRPCIITICRGCGIVRTVKNSKLNCPPWSSTDEGVTNTKRVLEAGELKQLDYISSELDEVWDCLYTASRNCNEDGIEFNDSSLGGKERSMMQEDLLRAINISSVCQERILNIIQKYEGLNKS